MTDPTPPANDPPVAAETAQRAYELFGLAALVVVLLVLMERDYQFWALLPCLVGLGGIAGRWSLALPLLLMTLAFVLLDLGPVRGYRGWEGRGEPLSDLLLCAAVLGYAAAQSRLQGVTRQMVPPDPRVRRKAKQEASVCRRALGDGELPLLLLALPFFAWLATLAWTSWIALTERAVSKVPHVLAKLPDEWQTLKLPAQTWQLLVLLWGLGLVLVMGNVLAAFCSWSQRGRTPEEAVLFLQDLFWRETRGEQRSVFRWLTWTRLRHERRKERT